MAGRWTPLFVLSVTQFRFNGLESAIQLTSTFTGIVKLPKIEFVFDKLLALVEKGLANYIRTYEKHVIGKGLSAL